MKFFRTTKRRPHRYNLGRSFDPKLERLLHQLPYATTADLGREEVPENENVSHGLGESPLDRGRHLDRRRVDASGRIHHEEDREPGLHEPIEKVRRIDGLRIVA